MLFEMYRFFRGIFGYGNARRRQHEVREELARDAKTQRAMARDGGHALSRLEKEMRDAEREATGG